MTFPRQVFERYTQPLALDVQPPLHLGRLRTEDGMRFFGLLSLRSHHGGYEDTVAVRNSHDKKFPLGIGFGGRVFCCDKLSFIADHIIRRKHTTNARRDLPALIGELVEPLAIQREQHHAFLRYQETLFPEAEANDAIMTMFRTGVINLARIAGVIGHWENPVISNGASGRLGDRSTPPRRPLLARWSKTPT